MQIEFENLNDAELIIDCVYKGGTNKNAGDDPLSHLFHCGNLGGFRKVNRKDKTNLPAYVILYTSMSELEWPDFLDVETGVFRYYGDNRKPGNDFRKTKKQGNLLLEAVFRDLNINKLEDIPPFLIFKKVGGNSGRDIQFLGLAAPGNPKISPDKDLVAFWRTVNEQRFQNYEAYFTILDTKREPISRKWLDALQYNHENSLQYAPQAWVKFIKKGRNGIEALRAPRLLKVPDKYYQLQSDNQGLTCLDIIRTHYKDNPYGFESCAMDLLKKMDGHFVDFNLTRPWRDGGRDAIGYYNISNGGLVNQPLKIDCALEAKCYGTTKGVGVREMSRLISRIRYRQFGVLMTTGYVDKQAYKEVIEDGHPILIVTASDIAGILRNNSISADNIDGYLQYLDFERAEWEDSL